MRNRLPLLPVLLVFFITVTVTSIRLSPGSFQEPFNRANQLYEEGKYSEALFIYLDIKKQGAHWKLYYNIGNCYYKLNNFVRAKIYYLRAKRLEPFEPSIRKNIEIVNKRFSDKIPAEKLDFLSRTALRIESFISLNLVSVLFLISVFILNAFIFILLKRGKSRVILYGVSFSLVITLLIFGYHIYRTGKQNLKNTAVIVKKDTNLRSGPGENNTILFKINPGLKVKIIDRSRNWLQVSASSQVAGWMEQGSLERI